VNRFNRRFFFITSPLLYSVHAAYLRASQSCTSVMDGLNRIGNESSSVYLAPKRASMTISPAAISSIFGIEYRYVRLLCSLVLEYSRVSWMNGAGWPSS